MNKKEVRALYEKMLRRIRLNQLIFGGFDTPEDYEGHGDAFIPMTIPDQGQIVSPLFSIVDDSYLPRESQVQLCCGIMKRDPYLDQFIDSILKPFRDTPFSTEPDQDS